MFAPDERPRGMMRGLLCAELLDFAAARFRAPEPGLPGEPAPPGGRGPEPEPACDPATCPGPAHLRALGDALARRTGVPLPVLLDHFGRMLFGRLVRAYPAFFVGIESTADLVARYQVHVAAELAKLDGSLEPPHLSVARAGAEWVVIYRSAHDLADLAAGLLDGSLEHFREPLELCREPLSGRSGGSARFVLRPRAEAGDRSTGVAALSAAPRKD